MKNGFLDRELPPELAELSELAFDLRWNNCPAARHLWSRFHPEIWRRTENPVLVLQSALQTELDAAAGDPAVLAELRAWRRDVDAYHNAEPVIRLMDPEQTLKRVAYFSMEFGLSESLPIYSGGLGMLAGDHLKTASDLGVPMVAIGLLYQQGYFRQVIGEDGGQLEAYPFNDPGTLPVMPVNGKDGSRLRVCLPLPGRMLFLRVWEVRVGRVSLYLLDSNDAQNTAWDRGITAQLYDSGRENRLLQEIVLGIGGWRLIEHLNLEVDVCHLNEGHAAFAVLARAAAFATKHRVPLREAFSATRAGNVFTTHTPVEAAFDRFDARQLLRYAQAFLDEVGLPPEQLLVLGRRNADDASEPFNMAWLAMRGSCHVNAVSQLHSRVSRTLFTGLFPRWPLAEIPVQPITNGVHVPTWASARAARFWEDSDGGNLWRDGLDHVADRIRMTTAEELWEFRTQQRRALLDYAADRYAAQLAHAASTSPSSSKPVVRLDPNVLTIGFARRFAIYKRANLLLSDPDRLKRLLLDPHRPIQLIVAGKAHPNDGFGKALVQKMTQFLRLPELRGHTVFLEDYDMVLAQHLVAGVDVWLNTPLRPNEACGTSGMKTLVNGGLNVSVMDGWWDEAVDPHDCETQPGWTVGDQTSGTIEEMAIRDAASLFEILENQVVPEFYDRDENGLPQRWLQRVKASMTQLTPQFSATRMMQEYVQHAYLPAARAFATRSADGAKVARDVLQWRDDLRTHWNHIRIGQVRSAEVEDGREIQVECWIGDLQPDAISVQLFRDAATGETQPAIVPLQQYRELPGSVNGFIFSGRADRTHPLSDYAIRIVPRHPHAFVPSEQRQILWDH